MEKSANEFYADLVRLCPEQRKGQIARFWRCTDGQPAMLFFREKVRNGLAKAMLRREKQSDIDAAADVDPPPDSAVAAIVALREMDREEAKGPTNIQGFGHFHAANNFFEELHTVLKTQSLLVPLGYRDQKLLNVMGVAKGYYIQNREFFRLLGSALVLEFHRITVTRSGRQFDIVNDRAEWIKWFKETAATRETLQWWFTVLEEMILPVLGMLGAVRQTLPTSGENAALESAMIATMLKLWFVRNKTTYLAIATGYLVTLKRLSERWLAIHAAHIGTKLSKTITPDDFSIEYLLNRDVKNMRSHFFSEAQLLETSDSVEQHTAVDCPR
jgi:hypothetical protein